MHQHPIYSTLFACLLAATAAAQDVYKVVDEKGRVTYTDNPNSENAKTLNLPPINTQPAVKPAPAKTTEKNTAAKAAYSIEISNPANETHLNPGQWDLTIDVSVKPGLKKEHFILLTDNGNPVQPPQKQTSFTISHIIRGSHALQAQIVNAKGKTISRSSVVNVYVHRVNVKP